MTDLPIDSSIASLQLEEEEEAARKGAESLGFAYVKLLGYPILPEVLRLIPQEDAVNYRMVAYVRAGTSLKVAISQPPTKELDDYLANLANQLNVTVKLAYCSTMSLVYSLTLYLKFKQQDETKAKEKQTKEGQDFTSTIKSIEDIAKQLQKVSTTQLMDLIFAGAVITNASDIHLEPAQEFTRLRFRIDGILQDVANITKGQYESMRSRIKNVASLKLDVMGAPQDGRFEIKVAGHTIDIRVSTLPASFGEDIVMRLLLEDAIFLKIDELGLNPIVLKLVKDAITSPHGMILNTGPTGSGKTTTLYAILSEVNHPETKVITIEDPVEYRLPGINQIQINPAANLTFASALRSAMRQDPDIIMVGEIRDGETAKIALQAALTGHLVLTTLHTNSAPAAIPRLLEMGIEPFLLAGSINLIIGQRLVRKICNVCAGQNKECTNCAGSGYKGRMPLVEALKPSEEFNELIARKASIAEFEKKARGLGMQSILDDGQAKVAAGLTTTAEIERVAKELN